jgi:hypothetical protein
MQVGDLGSRWQCAYSCLFNVCLMGKHSSTTSSHVCERHLKSEKKFMEHHIIPSMVKVVILLMGSLYPFVGQVFVHVFHSSGVSTSSHSPSKNSHTPTSVMYVILINTLFVPPCLSPSKSTPNPHLK